MCSTRCLLLVSRRSATRQDRMGKNFFLPLIFSSVGHWFALGQPCSALREHTPGSQNIPKTKLKIPDSSCAIGIRSSSGRFSVTGHGYTRSRDGTLGLYSRVRANNEASLNPRQPNIICRAAKLCRVLNNTYRPGTAKTLAYSPLPCVAPPPLP